MTVSKEFDAEQSHPLKVEEARVYGFRKSKRRDDEKEKWFQNNYCRNQGACVIAIIWLGQKMGRDARWARKIIVVGLRIGLYTGVRGQD
jgi:hypothetical protein